MTYETSPYWNSELIEHRTSNIDIGAKRHKKHKIFFKSNNFYMLQFINIEIQTFYKTINIERRILMTLCFIEFKTNELQNTEPQPATSSSVVSSGSNDSAESNFEEFYCLTQSFIKLIKFIIRCWTFISFFIDQIGCFFGRRPG